MSEKDFGSRLDLASLLAALEAREDMASLRNLADELRTRGVEPRPGRLRVQPGDDVLARIIIIADPDDDGDAPTHCPTCGQSLP